MFVPSASILDNLKIVLAAKALRCALPPVAPDDLDTVFAIPASPAIVDVGTGLLVFTTDVVCQYLALGSQLGNISEADTAAFDTFMRIEEVYLTTFLQSMISSALVGSGIVLYYYSSNFFFLRESDDFMLSISRRSSDRVLVKYECLC